MAKAKKGNETPVDEAPVEEEVDEVKEVQPTNAAEKPQPGDKLWVSRHPNTDDKGQPIEMRLVHIGAEALSEGYLHTATGKRKRAPQLSSELNKYGIPNQWSKLHNEIWDAIDGLTIEEAAKLARESGLDVAEEKALSIEMRFPKKEKAPRKSKDKSEAAGTKVYQPVRVLLKELDALFRELDVMDKAHKADPKKPQLPDSIWFEPNGTYRIE